MLFGRSVLGWRSVYVARFLIFHPIGRRHAPHPRKCEIRTIMLYTWNVVAWLYIVCGSILIVRCYYVASPLYQSINARS